MGAGRFIQKPRRPPNPGRKSTRFERCVDEVSRRGGVKSPEAVCATSLRRRKSNSVPAAAALSKAFHGRKARTATEVVEKLRVHGHLTDLGGMEELTIYNPDGRHGHRIRFGHDVRLASNERGTQLYFVDGDQALDLSPFPWVDGSKEKAEIGLVYSITYHTMKEHIRGRDGGEGSYEHIFGEEGGDPPVLLYDTRNDLIELAGGTYHVEVDRRTRLSPGIVD